MRYNRIFYKLENVIDTVCTCVDIANDQHESTQKEIMAAIMWDARILGH